MYASLQYILSPSKPQRKIDHRLQSSSSLMRDQDSFRDVILRSDLSRTCRYLSRGQFIANYGVCPSICERVWNLLHVDSTVHYKPVHLLMGLYFLKVYASESVSCRMFHVTEKTYRKWLWVVVTKLSTLNVVCLCTFTSTAYPVCVLN